MKKARSSTTARFRGWKKMYRWTAADPSLRWFRQNGSEHGCADRRHFRKSCGAGAAGADLGEAAEVGCRSRHRQPEIFPQDARQNRGRAGRHFAHRIHRRSRIRNMDTVESGGESLGCADGQRQAVRSSRRRNAGARCSARRSRIAADRSRLQSVRRRR
jgi:hypothetical protein